MAIIVNKKNAVRGDNGLNEGVPHKKNALIPARSPNSPLRVAGVPTGNGDYFKVGVLTDLLSVANKYQTKR